MHEDGSLWVQRAAFLRTLDTNDPDALRVSTNDHQRHCGALIMFVYADQEVLSAFQYLFINFSLLPHVQASHLLDASPKAEPTVANKIVLRLNISLNL